MPQENRSGHDDEESVRHAEWVREHPRIDDSAFPEYPDEPGRRGSSRGATLNGNPWRPVDPDEKPGRPEWDVDTLPASLDADAKAKEAPADEANGSDANGAHADSTDRVATAPPLGEPTHQPAVISADSEADQRIGRDIGDVLATSKMLDGMHLLVEVVDGDVYLHGTVADDTVRGEVGRLASSVRSAKRIFNELDVRS